MSEAGSVHSNPVGFDSLRLGEHVRSVLPGTGIPPSLLSNITVKE